MAKRWCSICSKYDKQCSDCFERDMKDKELEVRLAEAKAREAEARSRS